MAVILPIDNENRMVNAILEMIRMQDLKVNYSLSSSLYAASYYNIATIKLEPEKLMEMLTDVAFKSFEVLYK